MVETTEAVTYISLPTETISVNCTPEKFSDISYSRIYALFINVLVVPLLVIFGLAGNALSYVVWRLDSSTTTRFLRLLAVADSLYLITCLQHQTLSTLFASCSVLYGDFNDFYAYIERWAWPLTNTFQTMTVYFVVLLTLERYVVICYPAKRAPFSTTRRIQAAVFGVVIASSIYNIPTVFDLDVGPQTCLIRCERVTHMQAMLTVMFSNVYYQAIYKTILHAIFRTVLPLIVVAYLNFCLITAVWRSRKETQRYTGSHRGNTKNYEKRFTNSVICLILVFVVCLIPDCINRVVRTLKFMGIFTIRFDVEMCTTVTTNLLLTINSSANFLIYVAFGSKFQMLLKLTCDRYCRCRPDHRPRQADDETVTNHQLMSSKSIDQGTRLKAPKRILFYSLF